MATYTERRRASRRMVEPYFKHFAPTKLKELIHLGLLVGFVLLVGWVFHV